VQADDDAVGASLLELVAVIEAVTQGLVQYIQSLDGPEQRADVVRVLGSRVTLAAREQGGYYLEVGR
jgi:hypothetical protein